jgi:hypothetical protein
MKPTFFLVFCALLTAVSATEKLAPLPESTAPFAVAGFARDFHTTMIKGKTTLRFKGPAIHLMCYAKGTPQLESAALGKRMGGFSITVDGKTQRGVRGDSNEGTCYAFPNDGKLTLRLTPDGEIAVEATFPKANKLVFEMPLKGNFIGGARLNVDGRAINVPTFSGEAKHSYGRLFDGSAAELTFFAASPAKRFSIKPAPGTTCRIGCFYKNKHISLSLFPPKAGKTIAFVLDPGGQRDASLTAPAGRVHKLGAIDFWNHDRYCLPDTREKNLLQNSSFEQDMRYLAFRPFMRGGMSKEMWALKPIRITSKQAKFGRKSLRIFSDVRKRNLRQRISTHAAMLTPGRYTLSVYAKTTQPGRQKLNLYAVNPAHIYDRKTWEQGTFELTGEWKRYTIPVNIKAACAAPVAFSAESDCEATCFIDGMQLEKGDRATAYQPPAVEGALRTSAADNLVEYGRKVAARLDIVSAPGTAGTVSVRVRDFFDQIKHAATYRFKADSAGAATIKLPFETMPRGVFMVETDYDLPGHVRRYEIQRFAVMSFLDNTHKHKGLFADTYADPHGTQQFYPEVLARYKKIGIGARSGYFNRDSQLSKEAARYGVESTVCTMGWPYGRKNEPGRKIRYLENIEYYLFPGLSLRKALLVDDWRLEQKHVTPEYLRKVEAAAKHLAATSPEVKVWANLNEPEGCLPDLANPAYAKPEDFNDFVELECAVGRGVRAGNPNAMLSTSVSSSISTNDRRQYYDALLKETAKRGLRYDCLTAHIYRAAPEYPNDGLEGDFERLFAIMAKHGYDKTPVYCSEGLHWLPVRCYTCSFKADLELKSKFFGVLPYSYDMSYAEKLGSALRARTWLLGLKLHDRIKEMNASNFGIFAMDAMLTPYAFQKVPNTLGRLLGNAAFKDDLKLYPDTRCYVFDDDQSRPVAAIWACARDFDRGEVRAPEFTFKPAGKLELFDLMETQHSVTPGKDGMVRLPLSPFPVFLRGAPGSLKSFKAMLSAGRFKSLAPVRPSVISRFIDSKTLQATLNNPYPETLNGTLGYGAVRKPCRLAPGQKAAFTFKLPVQLSATAQQQQDMQLSLKVTAPETKTFAYSCPASAMLAKKAAKGVRVDGDLADWAGVPEIPIKRRLRGKKMSMAGTFPSAADFSARYQVCWDSDFLYLAVRVTDNKLGYKKQHQRSGWKNDSLQVFVDAYADARDFKEKKYGPDDWEYGIYLKDAARALYAYRHYTPDIQLAGCGAGAQPGTVAKEVRSAFRKTADGYVYEVAFPAKNLMPFQLRAGNTLGLGLLLNDSDDPAEPMPASRLTNASAAPNNRPDLWPVVMLVE